VSDSGPLPDPGAPASFQQLRELFDRVSDLPAAERDAEIARCTADDPRLGEELRALLLHSERAESPLDGAALRLSEPGDPPPLPRVPGFRLQRRIGRGGSATVYLAEQERDDFSREVALKVVDRVVDAPALRHVREEQRILARLEHPGIARLYDTGLTPLGQPYLAMEHVEGESILQHCRSLQLPTRARLELFLSVLDAVVYAHGEAVVHRDLKPANILVSARGEPKLLDFGIAKLVADPGDEDETRTLRRAMTPAYASPEQVRGDRVTAASDIYSLGVVLYELLADTLPYRLDGKRFETFEDAIREQDPEPPSDAFARTAGTTSASASARDRLELARRRRALRGDIDAVLLKALRKEPEARYASAEELADDLRRVLSGLPVAARRGDRVYRARKSLRRHRGAVALLLAPIAAIALQQVAGRWRGGTEGRPAGELLVYEEANPLDGETRRWLREGAARLQHFDATGSRESFRRALAAANGRLPGAALASDGLSRAESARGEVGRSAEAARRAWGLVAGRSVDLPRDEAERLRARALAAERRWELAIPALEGLFGRLPGRVDIGLDLVAALLAAGRSDEADNALGRLRQLHAGLADPGGDPRVDLVEAEVAMRLSEFQRAAAAAARVRERAAALGAVALGLRAERLHAEAIGRLDRRDEARRDLESVEARALAAGLEGEAAAARLGIGFIQFRTAGNDDARQSLEQARAGLRAAGSRPAEIVALVQLSLLAGKREEYSTGLRLSDEALRAAVEIRDRWSEGFVLSQRLVLLNWADDEVRAMAIAEATLAALRDSGNRMTLLSTLSNLASFRIERLELEQAGANLDEAEALARRVGSQSASGKIDRGMGYLQQTRGDLDLARQSYSAGLEKARRSGVPLEIGLTLSHLAWLEVSANRPDEAARYASEAIEAFSSAGDVRQAAGMEPIFAWVDARRGDAASARRRLAALKKASADESSPDFRLLSTEARVAEVLGDWRHAVEIRRQTIRMASEWETAGLVMEERLGLARSLHGMGDRRELEKLAAELLPEVERLGLRGVARDLRALLDTSPTTSPTIR